MIDGSHRICAIDIREAGLAGQIRAMHLEAYAQEAQLAGVRSLPPMERSVADLRALPETFHAIRIGNELAAAISVEMHAEPDGIEICSLAVRPAFQRMGWGRALLRFAIVHAGRRPIAVSTSAANLPALALYRSDGFAEHRRSVVLAGSLELVHLHRPVA